MTELERMSIEDVDTANRWLDAFDAAYERRKRRQQ
jgi:hypothetical protein